ncbi:MAG TPA: PAS domain S-box protein, partial [Allocoleopsis sp.]
FTDIIAKIERARPDVVFNTLNGDSNVAFYQQYHESGITASEIPIMAVSIAEAEFQQIGAAATGHYACWSYFQSLDTPCNRQFVQNFQARYGSQRVTSDPIEATYTQIYLWKQAVELAESFEVERVRVAAIGQGFDAPGGFVRIESNHHVSKACRIGRVLPTGQVEILWSSEKPIRPFPWLGVEQANASNSNVVIALLAEASQGIHKACQSEQKSRELEATKADLQREIAKRQRVEAVLSDSSAELQALFAAITDVVVVLDAQGRYLKIAPTNLALLYQPADELIGKTLHDVFPPTQASRLIEAIRKALETHETVDVEYSLMVEEKEVWFAANVSPLCGDSVIWVSRDITERKQAEEILRQQKELLQTIFDHIPVMVTLYDAKGQIQLVNRELERVLGWSLAELADCNVSAQCYTDRECCQQIWQLMLEPTGKWQDFKTKTRSGRVVDISWANIRLSDGTRIGIGQDITERKRAEEALRSSEERYRSVIAALAEGIVLQQADGNITAWNDAAQKILGLSEEQMKQLPAIAPIWQAIHEDGSPFPGEKYPAMVTLDTGKPQSNVVMGIHKLDGRLTWISMNSQPLFHPGETTPYAVVTSFSDITERKRVEEELRKTEERYRSIFENSDEGLFQTTPEGGYISANPALARIFGYSSPEDLIANLTDVDRQLYVDPEQRAAFLTRMAEDDMVSNFDYQVYRKDGSIIWVLENAHVVRDAKGEILYFEGSIVDITQRKIWEEALRYQQECTEDLLLNILPAPIAQRLKRAENTIADSFADVTVLFADLVNFTEIAAQIPPSKLVDLLNRIFSRFDYLSEKHGLEKIKTIGDAYMVVGGLPTPRLDHAEAIAEMALDMQREIANFKRDRSASFCLRIGIHTGPVVAGVIGMKKFTYDLWGDTVNVASRMESQGVPGGIQVTATTYERLKDKYFLERRGTTFVKGKGQMVTYWLTGRKKAGQ